MARGKYGARAAKRRAESAEEQLDRLLPQLVDAKRQAQRYRGEAEAATILRRQLTERREREGVPFSDHLAAVSAVEQDCREVLEAYERAITDLLHEMIRAGVVLKAEHDHKYVSEPLIEALTVLPHEATDELLRYLDWPRGMRRAAVLPVAISRMHELVHGRRLGGGRLAELDRDSELSKRLRSDMSRRWEKNHSSEEVTAG